ncbi:MAG: HAMP domain-containing histidine kinase [Bacteroidia bacterium]|nr:HAMP domain-containing histidine kinase [Bacteroidia bacterium]MCF8427247.1 HAMP domain-containing histidine kinase [Bacteroidia bacterium]MCF8445993.1 HAMP domain-containing histidine kinase [Bacteroidia bacterium]
MNIKSNLTIKFTAIVAAIFIGFSIFTYEFSEIFRKNEFTDRLYNVSENVVYNYLDKVEITPELLKLIFQKQLNRFPNERLIIADQNYEVVFASHPIKDIEIDLLKKLYKTGTLFEHNEEETEFIAYTLQHGGQTFFIISSAVDAAGIEKLDFLRFLLVILNISCIVIASISGWYFSKQALQPIKDVISQVDTINESNLYQRVNEGNGKDEIANLAIVFNKMLERIEKSFVLQKLFVANASHEFRTPLTVMKGQIEVLLLQERSKEEYLNTYSSILDDIQNLISLLNGLTELAAANVEFPKVNFGEVSILEVMMESRDDLVKRKPQYHINYTFKDNLNEDEMLVIEGDHSLLKSVFTNLMDNACKFTYDNTCEVKISFYPFGVDILVIDKGSGIGTSDLAHVFEPFYRSNETRNVPGYGIGLSLVKKTIDLHAGEINIKSELGRGTIVRVILPNALNKITPIIEDN